MLKITKFKTKNMSNRYLDFFQLSDKLLKMSNLSGALEATVHKSSTYNEKNNWKIDNLLIFVITSFGKNN